MRMLSFWLKLGVRAMGLAVLCGAALTAPAQRYTPPPPPLVVDPCAAHPAAAPAAADSKAKPPACPSTAPAVPAAKSSAAEGFPFPGDAPPAQTGSPAASTTPSARPGSVADQFPYPGETSASSDAVPEGNTPRYVPDAPAPGEAPSGSSSSSSSSDAAPAPDEPAPTTGRGRRRLPKVSAASPDERAANDLDVAKFYTDRGNFQAAYLRAQNATKVMPSDPESHFALAQAAEKLHKKDEAVAEYGLYLKLDPAGDKKATAQRALVNLR